MREDKEFRRILIFPPATEPAEGRTRRDSQGILIFPFRTTRGAAAGVAAGTQGKPPCVVARMPLKARCPSYRGIRGRAASAMCQRAHPWSTPLPRCQPPKRPRRRRCDRAAPGRSRAGWSGCRRDHGHGVAGLAQRGSGLPTRREGERGEVRTLHEGGRGREGFSPRRGGRPADASTVGAQGPLGGAQGANHRSACAMPHPPVAVLLGPRLRGGENVSLPTDLDPEPRRPPAPTDGVLLPKRPRQVGGADD